MFLEHRAFRTKGNMAQRIRRKGDSVLIGSSASSKIGFYGATPVARPASADQAAAPAGGTGATAGAYDTAANRDKLIALVNEMRSCLVNAGLMKGSA